MNVGANRGRLVSITKDLALKWEETVNFWRDSKSQEFERKYMEELLAHVDKTATVIQRLDELLTRVRHDCE